MPGSSTILLALLLSAATLTASAPVEPIRAPAPKTGSEILWSIQKLNTLGRALYVAAHPDDENTGLISYLSLGGKYDTAYLSMTRGDGGQNLIGPELGDQLGVIRTQELLAARSIDRGRQFFTRAKDFGFSKHPDETFTIWDREKVLADTVWVIRNFRPDVIITRFNEEPGYTHGHHTASTILALEAFEAAADPRRFPEQLDLVDVWQAKRVVWNTSSWFFSRSGAQFDESEYVKVDAGGYEPLLGRSYNEVASASRSMHRSQGFGTRIERGARPEYFKHLAGEPMDKGLFDGVDTSWNRVEGSDAIASQIDDLLLSFNVSRPADSIPELVELRRSLDELADQEWARAKIAEVDAIIADSMGLHLRALLDKPYVLPGESLEIAIEAINRSEGDAMLKSVEMKGAAVEEKLDRKLLFNDRIEESVTVRFPRDLPLPQPYWLVEQGELGMFEVEDQTLIGEAENEPVFSFIATLAVDGEELKIALPLEYREVDPAKGEVIRPVVNVPPASVTFDSPVTLFPNYESQTVTISVTAIEQPISGAISLELAPGWRSDPMSYEVRALDAGETRTFAFEVAPPKESSEVVIGAALDVNGQEIRSDMRRIRYEHIPEQNIFARSATRAVSLQVARKGQRVAYLPGAGDSVGESIRAIGYEVTQLDPAQIDSETLRSYDTLVVGIRAYNTIDVIDRLMPSLFGFVEQGGTVIVQYNTAHRLNTEQLGPYPIRLSRDRVTDETAEVRLLAPNHPALNTPNKIDASDFDGWIQERGLYFPTSWDAAYTPILSTNDVGEPARDGSLLVARHGDGYFVYTGLSFFRQLPAGVPGAYRLFANLISLGHD